MPAAAPTATPTASGTNASSPGLVSSPPSATQHRAAQDHRRRASGEGRTRLGRPTPACAPSPVRPGLLASSRLHPSPLTSGPSPPAAEPPRPRTPPLPGWSVSPPTTPVAGAAAAAPAAMRRPPRERAPASQASPPASPSPFGSLTVSPVLPTAGRCHDRCRSRPPGSPAGSPHERHRDTEGGPPPGCGPDHGCAQRRRWPCGDGAQKHACGPAATASHRDPGPPSAAAPATRQATAGLTRLTPELPS